MKHLKQKLPILLIMLFSFCFFNACTEDDPISVEKKIVFENTIQNLTVGDEMTLTPKFSGFEILQKSYNWSVSDESILKIVKIGDDFTSVVAAIGEGEAEVTISTTDGDIKGSTKIITALIRETEAIIPDSFTAFTQSEVIITPEFNLVPSPLREYTWSAEPAGMLDFTVDDVTKAITMQGLQEGTATLSLKSTDGVISTSTQITILDENDGVLKILAIGNSFSEDALESYLWEIANASGKEIVIGNMYIGSSDLEIHADNADSDSGSYSYRKISINGDHSTSSNVSLSTAIKDENWDYISFQQASYFSGLYDTYTEPLPRLYNKVKEWDTNEYTKYVFHRTWAYAKNSTHSGFPNYNSDQLTMFNAIVDAYNQAESLVAVDFVSPAGTAIQNARTSYLEDGFTRDGFHLNNLGKYTAGCTWFEMLFNESVIGNTFVPDGIIDFNIELAQNAAHEAVANPKIITELVNFKDPGGTGILTEPVLINFSSSTTPAGWNAYTSHLDNSTIPNLTYTDNTFTGIKATITERFRGINNTSGESDTDTNLNLPDDVSRSNFYVNGKTWGNNAAIEQSVIEFTGFKSTDTYEFCFFGSRANVSDNRETKYTVIGDTEQSSSLNTASNKSETVCISNVKADADGKITLIVSMGDNNTSNNGFYYLNAMRIQPK